MQVGRKVAQVLESLGRSAETIQEAEVGSFVANYHCWSCQLRRHRRHSPPCSRPGEEVLQGESQFEGPEGKQYLGRVQPAQQQRMASCEKATKRVRKTFRCDPDLGSDRLYYLALRAVDRYYDQWGADPGALECQTKHKLKN